MRGKASIQTFLAASVNPPVLCLAAHSAAATPAKVIP